jgi:hypothetical protein
MSKNIFSLINYVIFVFIQVFFIDSFEVKLGLIFIPLLASLFQNDSKQFLYKSFILLFAIEFFRNNFVSIPLFIFLVLNFGVDQFSKIWSKEILLILKFVVVYFLYNFYSFGILNYSFLVNTVLIIGLFIIRRVLRGGYIRFN